ncbi:hypothetical protein ES705_05003 [subsurface metagenome]
MPSGVYVRTKEHREILSKALKGRTLSGEYRENLSKIMKIVNNRPEVKKKNSESHKGNIPWSKGLTKETDERLVKMGESISKALTGKIFSEEWKRNISKAMTGKKLSEEIKRKISESQKGHKVTEETRRKISEVNKGKIFSEKARKNMSEGQKGKKMPPVSEETKRKMSEARKGDKCYLWQGGISFEPYSVDWTRTLRRSIRERDYYTCQLCGELQSDRALSVHHIDYDKKNCNPTNLIALCVGCNTKVNNNRENWTKYFKVEEQIRYEQL